MKEKRFRAAAKINLCLHVLGRRMDGYHELAMAMQQVSLFDIVDIRIGGQPGIRVRCAGVSLPPTEENIAAKAARLLLREAQIETGVDIKISKRIPVAAGLGGGSSDAATVLMGLNELLDLDLAAERLRELGGQLGSDVPFFILQCPAWATGTGTVLQELPDLPKVSYVLVNPGVAVSTGEVYQSLRLTKGGDLASIPRFSARTPDELRQGLHNDLEGVVLPRCPVISEIKERLLAAGAMGALMSGSGATVFGVFEDTQKAAEAAVLVKAGTSWFAEAVEPI